MTEKLRTVLDLAKSIYRKKGYCKKVKEAEKYILACKDPEASLEFIADVKEARFRAHEKVILDSKNPMCNEKFLEYFNFNLFVASYKIKTHGKVILESNDEASIARFKCIFKKEYKELNKKLNKTLDEENELDKLIK